MIMTLSLTKTGRRENLRKEGKGSKTPHFDMP
jgi:hypothetical protein